MYGNIAHKALLFALVVTAISLQTHSLTRGKEEMYPHIVQYIDNFSLSSDDLKKLILNQFSKITISQINTTAYEVTSSNISLSYSGKQKHTDKISPLKVIVSNDSFTVSIQFEVKVAHAVGGKNYTCNTSIPSVMISYVKEVDFATGSTLITSLNSSYSSASFSEAACKQTIAKNDKSAINNAVSSSQGGSIYLQLKKTMDKIQAYFSLNAKEDRLSRVYDHSPYTYEYNRMLMDVNVSILSAETFGDSGIQNAISATIADTSNPAVPPPPYEEGFSTFYSLQFMKNVIEYASKNLAGWREIKLNRNNMRTKVFRWRLVDFQYIAPSVLEKYPSSYLNDVEINCAVEDVGESVLDQKNLQIPIGWRCLGSFEGPDKKKVTFINFLVTLRHWALFSLQETSLNVRVDKVELQGLQFDYVEDFQVIDPFTVSQFISEGLFEFRVYTVGTFFKIGSPSLKKKLIPGRGMWIA